MPVCVCLHLSKVHVHVVVVMLLVASWYRNKEVPLYSPAVAQVILLLTNISLMGLCHGNFSRFLVQTIQKLVVAKATYPGTCNMCITCIFEHQKEDITSLFTKKKQTTAIHVDIAFLKTCRKAKVQPTRIFLQCISILAICSQSLLLVNSFSALT